MKRKDYVLLKLYREDIRRAFPERNIGDKECDELLKHLQTLHENHGILSDREMRNILGPLQSD